MRENKDYPIFPEETLPNQVSSSGYHPYQEGKKEERKYSSSKLPGRQPIRYSQEQSPYKGRQRNNSQLGGEETEFSRRGKRKKKKNHSHTPLYIGIVFLCMIILTTLGMFMAPQLLGIFSKIMPNYAFANGKVIPWDETAYLAHQKNKKIMESHIFYPGIFVDGISLADKTYEEAKEILANTFTQENKDFSVTIHLGEESHKINSEQVPLHTNTEEVLKQAYAVGRQNNLSILGTSTTPFGQRVQTVMNVEGNPINFQTATDYDKTRVKELIQDFVLNTNKEPIDAQLKSFDFSTRTFSFTKEEEGYGFNQEEIYEKVIEKLNQGEYGAEIVVEPNKILPQVTKVDLMNNFKRISSFTTKTTNNANRNTNVYLSAQALNGRVVNPGETFSFNETTGKRTQEAGYKEAVAISGGQNVPDIGGGVCQTSTTLFNAVLMADLEIVDRTPHAWPSSYVDIGMDATVNWPNLDFKFKNNQDYPIFVIAFYEDQEVTVEIYGKSLGNGITIALESERTKTIEPPKETQFVRNEKLSPGTQKATTKARSGYEAETYKIWYKDGEEFKRESFTSKYRMYANTIEYN